MVGDVHSDRMASFLTDWEKRGTPTNIMFKNFTNSYGSHFVVTGHTSDWPSELLRDEQSYDCFVVNRRDNLSEAEIGDVAATLARSRCGWIEVFGFDAERIHDAIDEASVTGGRQSKVGDGDPMTTWNNDLTRDSEIAAYAWTGGQGVSDWKLILVIDDQSAVNRMYGEIRRLATSSSQ